MFQKPKRFTSLRRLNTLLSSQITGIPRFQSWATVPILAATRLRSTPRIRVSGRHLLYVLKHFIGEPVMSKSAKIFLKTKKRIITSGINSTEAENIIDNRTIFAN
jgi:hypothetical protein